MPLHQLPLIPDMLRLQQLFPERYPYWLESVAKGTPQARYDILFAFPLEIIEASDAQAFFPRFDKAWKAQQRSCPEDELQLPFRGGWFMYLGYEAAAEVEPRLHLPANQTGLPKAFATRIPAAFVCDHGRQCTWLVAEEERWLRQLEEDWQCLIAQPVLSEIELPRLRLYEDAPTQFLHSVDKIKDYIRAGDVFQVNLSRAWHGSFQNNPDPIALYQRLRRQNPGPFAGLARYRDHALISSSPERLVSWQHGVMQARPIAGTYPRGRGSAQDSALANSLLRHPKERAEHIMLIDLIRNDLGRLALPGTVRVDELMVIESYAHVHHIVSNVCAQTKLDVTPSEVLKAVFPGGTITGCPKVRCMEIIAELEQVARGPYTGSMGYVNHDGQLDFNILIRTLHLYGKQLSLRAGAGIVADSEPERELRETSNKARGLLLALAED